MLTSLALIFILGLLLASIFVKLKLLCQTWFEKSNFDETNFVNLGLEN